MLYFITPTALTHMGDHGELGVADAVDDFMTLENQRADIAWSVLFLDPQDRIRVEVGECHVLPARAT